MKRIPREGRAGPRFGPARVERNCNTRPVRTPLRARAVGPVARRRVGPTRARRLSFPGKTATVKGEEPKGSCAVDQSEMLHQMCHEVLAEADLRAICKNR